MNAKIEDVYQNPIKEAGDHIQEKRITDFSPRAALASLPNSCSMKSFIEINHKKSVCDTCKTRKIIFLQETNVTYAC